MGKIDFQELNTRLAPHGHGLVTQWLSGGKINGPEWRCGSINGGAGNSFGVNLTTFRWGDLNAGATHKGGGDLISLYAAINSVSNISAARTLATLIGFESNTGDDVRNNPPKMISQKHGAPSGLWKWQNERGSLLGITVRYDYLEDNKPKKQFYQWHFDDKLMSWVPKSIAENRPLYNLPTIINNPTKKILIVEGETSVDAAQKMLGNSVIVTTWIGGSKAVKKTNWTPLTSRDVVIWPDNDEAGFDAAVNIGLLLQPLVSTLKVYEVDKLKLPVSFDAADVLKSDISPKKMFADLLTVERFLKPISSPQIQSSATTPIPSVKLAEVEVLSNEPTLADVKQSIEIDVDGGVDKFERLRLNTLWDQLGLQWNFAHTIVNCNMVNVYYILTRHERYASKFFQDDFKSKRYYGETEWREGMEYQILFDMQGKFGLAKISLTSVKEALSKLFLENRRNLLKEYLESLIWDQAPRIDRFFIEYYGAHDTTYSAAVSKNFWIGMVRRATKPSTKFDNMVIIEGVQGVKKSSSLEAIGGKYYLVMGDDPSNKDFFLKLIGTMLVEVAELDSFRKAEATTLKRVLSTNTDNFRKPYASEAAEHPRTCILVGTTNKKDYLSDTTGNRRYWPIEATEIDLDGIKRDRDQLFAEAYLRAQTDETHWEVPTEHLNKIYENRMNIDKDDSPENDPWYGIALKYQENIFGTFDIAEFMVDEFKGLGMDIGKISNRDRGRVAKILRHIGYKQTREILDNGSRVRTWTKLHDGTIELKPDLKKPINYAPQTAHEAEVINNARNNPY